VIECAVAEGAKDVAPQVQVPQQVGGRHRIGLQFLHVLKAIGMSVSRKLYLLEQVGRVNIMQRS